MKKIAIFLICTMLLAICVNLYPQNPYCEWNDSKKTKNLTNITTNIIYYIEEGCIFRFVLWDAAGLGWSSQNWIDISVDGVDYGSVTLPWGMAYIEETVLLPSGVVQFTWNGYYSFGRHCFEIYNSSNELISESPYPEGFSDPLFLIYQNDCPKCTPLTDFEGAYNSATKQVHLYWVAPESEDLTGFDIYRNDELIAQVAVPTNSYSDNTAALQAGAYKYCVVPVYPFICIFDENCFETNINVGINNYSSNIHLYPNPANNELRITATAGSATDLLLSAVEIFDVYGRKQCFDFAQQPSHVSRVTRHDSREMVINISNLPAGVYIVKIFTERGVIVEKMVKM